MSQVVANLTTRRRTARAQPRVDRPVRRYVFAGLGVVCVGIGAVAVFVPGLPTTIWLLAASYLFARSNPRLEAKLIRNRFFGPYLQYMDNPASMPFRAKFIASTMMWGSVIISIVLLGSSDRLPLWLGATLIGAAALGTTVIWRLGRGR